MASEGRGLLQFILYNYMDYSKCHQLVYAIGLYTIDLCFIIILINLKKKQEKRGKELNWLCRDSIIPCLYLRQWGSLKVNFLLLLQPSLFLVLGEKKFSGMAGTGGGRV